jgi:hypothetical protein
VDEAKAGTMKQPPRLIACACGAALALGALTAGPALAASASTNWAGYVAAPLARDAHFKRVLGTWREPIATCEPGHETYSAVWVGLGGYNESSRALEQVGTDADCTRSGRAAYSSWYELLPAEPVNLRLRVHPGDSMAAAVTVAGRYVTLTIRDLTTGSHLTTTRRASVLDTGTAEWIVEAPSACPGGQVCQVLALTNFGTVTFSSANATLGSHAGPVTDAAWRSLALELQQRTPVGFAGRTGTSTRATHTLTAATATQASAPYGAFTVNWREQTLQEEQPSEPTLPALGGGPP